MSQRKNQLCFVEHLEISFSQKTGVCSNAIVLGDVDNDGNIELVVGGLGGELALFKENKLNPWKISSELGSIVSLTIGDIHNIHQNSLVVLTGEGYCFVFDLSELPKSQPSNINSQSQIQPQSQPIQSQSQSLSQLQTQLQPLSQLQSQSQIQSQSLSQLQSQSQPQSQSLSQLQSQSQIQPEIPFKEENNMWKTEEIIQTFSHRVIHNSVCSIITDIDEDGYNELIIATSGREVYSYKLVKKGPKQDIWCLEVTRKWLLPDKPTSLSSSEDSWGRRLLIISQNTLSSYSIIDHKGNLTNKDLKNSFSSDETINHEHRIGSTLDIKNFSRPPVCGGQVQSKNLLAMASINGQVQLRDEQKILWNLKLPGQLFCLNVFDLTGSGTDQIVLSSWDGTTYIIDEQSNYASFQFEERVCAFTAGNFSVRPGEKVPCLIFVTFYEEIFIYYNIRVGPLLDVLNKPIVPHHYNTLSLLSSIYPEDKSEIKKLQQLSLKELEQLYAKLKNPI